MNIKKWYLSIDPVESSEYPMIDALTEQEFKDQYPVEDATDERPFAVVSLSEYEKIQEALRLEKLERAEEKRVNLLMFGQHAEIKITDDSGQAIHYQRDCYAETIQNALHELRCGMVGNAKSILIDSERIFGKLWASKKT